MEQPNTFQVFEGNNIILVGTPVVLVAIDRPGDDYGQIEFYAFVFKQPDGFHYIARKIEFNGIPRTTMSDEFLLARGLKCAEGELESYLQARREELKGLISPDCRYDLIQVGVATFLYYVIARKLFDRARQIRNQTACEDLEKFLAITSKLTDSSIVTE